MTGRWTSRKFLLALGSFITFIANHQYGPALTVALTFLGIEGAIDHRNSAAVVGTPDVSATRNPEPPRP